MGCMQSTPTEAATSSTKQAPETAQSTSGGPTSLAKPGKLTSLVYNDTTKVPTHWTDTAFLIPHEWLRREMSALAASCQALPDTVTEADSWKAEFLATWILQVFYPVFIMHHTNEEDIYVPMLMEHGCKIEDKKISQDHETLVKQLQEIQALADTMEKAKGLNCATAISSLKTKVATFVVEMGDHLKEEEETLPPAMLAAQVPKEDSDKAVEKIIQAGGLDGLKTEIPGVIVAMQDWATEAHYQEFLKEIPPPILKLQLDILVPNYKTWYCPMRDAPTMDSKPELTQLPFDPSMLPPPPPAE